MSRLTSFFVFDVVDLICTVVFDLDNVKKTNLNSVLKTLDLAAPKTKKHGDKLQDQDKNHR